MIAVDLFAGWGGMTLGASMAGARVAWAANHWPLAVQAHALNHPETAHACQDLRQADWLSLPAHDVLLAAPCCQGHSPAAQGARKASGRVRATHDALRATAWAVVDCVEVCRPRAVVVENVPRFRRWGELEGQPGAFFDHWLQALRLRGYRMTVQVLSASRHGDTPQRRDRLFVVGVRGDYFVDLRLPERVEPAFGPCIDWRADVPWTRVRDASPAVRNRIARSRPRHGERFLTQHTRDHMGVGLHEPIRTITGGDQWAIVDGDRYRPLTERENARAMGFPDSYRWPAGAKRKDVILGLGNAVPPRLARRVIERVGGYV